MDWDWWNWWIASGNREWKSEVKSNGSRQFEPLLPALPLRLPLQTPISNSQSDFTFPAAPRPSSSAARRSCATCWSVIFWTSSRPRRSSSSEILWSFSSFLSLSFASRRDLADAVAAFFGVLVHQLRELLAAFVGQGGDRDADRPCRRWSGSGRGWSCGWLSRSRPSATGRTAARRSSSAPGIDSDATWLSGICDP